MRQRLTDDHLPALRRSYICQIVQVALGNAIPDQPEWYSYHTS